MNEPYQDENGIWHIDDVAICSTGIEYKLASGPTTFTEAMLADAVKAANDDLAIKDPRIKLGHSSSYNEQLVGDAEQAFGRVENLRLGENNQTIFGDYVGLPEWLAKVMPIAYPSRSIEGAVDVETVTGKMYELVITAVGSLGVVWPGVSVLEDLPVWYGADIPDGVQIFTTAEDIAASGGGMDFKNRSEFEAAVDVSLIRRKFYNDGPGAENWQYWIRGERFDSSEGYNLIVDMGDGELCRYPVEVDGSEVTFGEYTIVTEEYPDKATAAPAVLAGMAMVDGDMVIYASRAESPDIPTREGAQMDEATRTSLAAKLGLPEDATEAQINAKMAEQVLASTEDPGDPPPPADPADPPADPPDPATPAGPTVEAGTVTVDKATWDQTLAGAELARKHESEAVTKRINDTVEAAVNDGRIAPARRKFWVAALTADYEGAKITLDGLEPGLVPLVARGVGGGDVEGITVEGAAQGLPEDWFPEIRERRLAAAANLPVTQAKEG